MVRRWLSFLFPASMVPSPPFTKQAELQSANNTPSFDRHRILDSPIEDPPQSWALNKTFMVGGLIGVGFGANDRYLLVISHDGRGIIDCETLEKVGRDPDSSYEWLDESSLNAEGIGPLEGEIVPVAGLAGGSLSDQTSDGWIAQHIEFPGHEEHLIIEAPNGSTSDIDPDVRRLRPPTTEVRAFGFSPAGRTLVLGTSSDLTIYRRQE